MLAQCYFDAGKIDQGVAELDRAINEERAAGRVPPESWYSFAIARLNARGDRAGTATWLMREAHDFPTLANWRRVIVLYRNSPSTPRRRRSTAGRRSTCSA